MNHAVFLEIFLRGEYISSSAALNEGCLHMVPGWEAESSWWWGNPFALNPGRNTKLFKAAAPSQPLLEKGFGSWPRFSWSMSVMWSPKFTVIPLPSLLSADKLDPEVWRRLFAIKRWIETSRAGKLQISKSIRHLSGCKLAAAGHSPRPQKLAEV